MSSEEDLLLPAGETIEEDGAVEEQVAVGKDDRIEEMEERLARMMREICDMEERVAEVAGRLAIH
jgi:hypothetical protein